MRNEEAAAVIREVLDGVWAPRILSSRRRRLRRAYDAVTILSERARRREERREIDEVEERATRLSDRVPWEGA